MEWAETELGYRTRAIEASSAASALETLVLGRETVCGRGHKILDRRLTSQSSGYGENGFLWDVDWTVSA